MKKVSPVSGRGKVLLLACIVIVGSAATGPWASAAGDDPGLVISDLAGGGVRIELTLPGYALEPAAESGNDGAAGMAVRLDGLVHTRVKTPGAPALPVKIVPIDVPEGMALEVEVLEAEGEWIRRVDIAPAPTRIVAPVENAVELWGPAGAPTEVRTFHIRDESLYGADREFPAHLVRTGPVMRARDRRFVRLVLHPVQYNPVRRTLRVHERLVVSVRFTPLAGVTAGAGGREGGVTASVVTPPFPGYGGFDAYKVSVAETGIRELTYGDLVAAGIDLASVDPDHLRMFNDGEELAIYVSASGGVGAFGADDVIRFYGEQNSSQYSYTRVYWLVLGDAAGLRMATRDGTPTGGGTTPESFPHTVRAEDNFGYQMNLGLEEGGDSWLWGPPVVFSKTFPVTLSHVAAGSGDVTIRVKLYGFSEDPVLWPDHHVRISLNGVEFADEIFDGMKLLDATGTVDQSDLMEGGNTLTVEIPGDTGSSVFEMVIMDKFDVTYGRTFQAEEDRLTCSTDVVGEKNLVTVEGFSESEILVFDITDPTAPARILDPQVVSAARAYTVSFDDTPSVSTRYAVLARGALLPPDAIAADVPTSLSDTGNQADYVMISHPDFIDAVEPLALYRRGLGLTVKLVDVIDVYDEFNFGNASPEAIKAFLAHTYLSWQAPAPRYALLVGDGTYDYKKFFDASPENFIPPKILAVGKYKVPSDTDLACVDGTDLLPDITIGRFPVNTEAEAATIVQKIIGYETDPDTTDFDTDVLLVADDKYNSGSYTGTPFEEDTDTLDADFICPPHSASKAYQRVYGTDSTVAIRNAINAGTLLVNYRGHGDHGQWAESMFTAGHVRFLSNAAALPIVITSTCMDGYYIIPLSGFDSLSETLLRTADKGSVAGISPASYSVDAEGFILNRGYFEAIFTKNKRVLSEIVENGRFFFASQIDDLGILLYVTLFGDPALRLPLGVVDTDTDGVADNEDNCPDLYDPGQENFDLDCLGDVCDADDDEDGFDDDLDCGPRDEDIHPFAAEICDGLDSNCDEWLPFEEADDDMDGYVECTLTAVKAPGIVGGDDCDDTDPLVSPGFPEGPFVDNCADGKDNDCDGLEDGFDPDCLPPSCRTQVATGANPSAVFVLIPLFFLLLRGGRRFRR